MSEIPRQRKYLFQKAAVGGTFDILHRGHHALLSRALQISEHVLIGVVSDELAPKLEKKHQIRPFKDRVDSLIRFIRESGWPSSRLSIVPLKDKYGAAATDPSIQAIVITDETEPNAKVINDIRKEAGLSPLHIEKIAIVLGEDGLPISTTRIRNREIDAQGRRLG